MSARDFSFTLIELLIVIGMLGVLATLVLPCLASSKTAAFDPIVQTEMQNIRLAFQRFRNDVMPNDNQLEFFKKYGLAPLMQRELAGAYAKFDLWDCDRHCGWRGPYLEIEDTRTINSSSDGQLLKDGNIEIPVILDPYSKEDNDERYYRVLCGKKNESIYDKNKLAVVFIGVHDDTLGTTVYNDPKSKSDWVERYFDIGVDGVDEDGKSRHEIVKKLVIDCE